jgi:hypothetical protein
MLSITFKTSTVGVYFGIHLRLLVVSGMLLEPLHQPS